MKLSAGSHDAAFEAFVAGSSRRLLHTAELLTGDPHAAEDLLQGVLLRMYARWPRIRQDDPVGYARRALVNASTDGWRRRRNREVPAARPPDRPASGDVAVQAASRDALLRALGLLTRRERAVVVLRFYDDLSEAQIAATLGIAPGTVKSACSRAMSKLRAAPHLTALTEETTS